MTTLNIYLCAVLVLVEYNFNANSMIKIAPELCHCSRSNLAFLCKNQDHKPLSINLDTVCSVLCRSSSLQLLPSTRVQVIVLSSCTGKEVSGASTREQLLHCSGVTNTTNSRLISSMLLLRQVYYCII